MHVDPRHVVEWMRSSRTLQTFEQDLLDNVPHLSLTYEKHLRDPSSHQATVDEICQYLGIESAPVETSYQKISPRSLKEAVQNYDDLVDYLDSTEYARYLDE